MVAKDSNRRVPRRTTRKRRVKRPILVFGAGGQLGREVLALANARGVETFGCDHAQANVAEFEAVEAVVRAINPRLIVNAAAFTAVDKAETEPEAAFAANVTGASNVSRAAKALELPIIHISTDYVFNGAKSTAYVETDILAPLGVYGRTKAEGENAVRAANPRHFIVRTAWVYGRHGANFLKTMLRLAAERDELRVVADQRGCPTATVDLAEAIFAIDLACVNENAMPGVYHFSGQGATTSHGFASAIVETQASFTGRRPRVTPIATSDYPTPARRPANSELNCELFTTNFGYRAREWQSRMQETVNAIFQERLVSI